MGSSPEPVDQHLVVDEAEQIRVYGRPMEIEQGNRAADGVVEEMRLIGVRTVLGAAGTPHAEIYRGRPSGAAGEAFARHRGQG
jgi:hypothetical protein